MASMKMMEVYTWRGNSKLEEASSLRKEIMENYEIFLSEGYDLFITSLFKTKESLTEITLNNPEFRNLTILNDVINDYLTLNKANTTKHISFRDEGIIESHTLSYKGNFLIIESLTNKKGTKLRYHLIPCLDIDILVTNPIDIDNLKLFAEAMLKSQKDYALEEINNTLLRLKMSGLSNEEILNTLQMAYTSFKEKEVPENRPLEENGVKLS